MSQNEEKVDGNKGIKLGIFLNDVDKLCGNKLGQHPSRTAMQHILILTSSRDCHISLLQSSVKGQEITIEQCFFRPNLGVSIPIPFYVPLRFRNLRICFLAIIFERKGEHLLMLSHGCSRVVQWRWCTELEVYSLIHP